MTREEFIILLKTYKENNSKLKIALKDLKNRRIRLKEFDDSDTNITSSFGINQDIHSKNKISNKVLKKVEENDEKIQNLKEEIKELEKQVRELREKVEAVDDRLECLKYKEEHIFKAYYIDGRTYSDIGENLYLQLFKQTRDKDTIKNIVEKAMEKIINL